MIVLDTNILVYAHRRALPEHEPAKAAIEAACNNSRGVGIATATVVEFLSVVTHPKAAMRPSTVEESAEFIALLESTGGIRICLPHPGFHRRLAQLARDLKVSGPRLFDLQIALTGLDNGATQIWTRDSRFVKVPGLDLVNPI